MSVSVKTTLSEIAYIYVVERRHCKRCTATKDLELFYGIDLLYEMFSERKWKMSQVRRTNENILAEGSNMRSSDRITKIYNLSKHLETLKHIESNNEKECEVVEEENKLKEEDEKRKKKEETKEEEEERKRKEEEERKTLEEAEEKI